jgi:hypothetical protein
MSHVQRFLSIWTKEGAELLGLAKKDSSTGGSEKTVSPSDPSSTSTPLGVSTAANAPQAGDSSAMKAHPNAAESVERSVRQNLHFGRQYISHTRSTFNGRDYVEEHREKVMGTDGETRIATQRRLGDRWYENKTHIDKDGKKTARETWHNAGDEDIEGFIVEWRKKHPSVNGDDCGVKTDASESAIEAGAIEGPCESVSISTGSPT